MSHSFRILETGFNTGAFNMALDQTVLEGVASQSVLPTIRFYGWNPWAVSIGYFQGLEEEVDTQACAKQGIDVVRRITGGGAVFHQAEVTYSIIIPETHPLYRQRVLDSYELICQGIIDGLRVLGVQAQFAPINDIVVDNRKVSGNAQTRKLGCILQHGTILLDVDVELMFSLLRVPSEKAKGKLIEDVKARVRGLGQILGREVSFGETVEALKRGFQNALDLDYQPGVPMPHELERASVVAQERFANPEWNRRR